MRINIVCVGKIKEKYWADAIIEYQKRIKKFCEINILEVKDEPNKNGIDCKKIEGERILEILPQGYNIVLAINGKELDSIAFSEKISDIFTYNSSCINFIIGGSLGLSDSVNKKADFLLSFSKMTFPHQMMRVVLLEQIYRAFKIINNESYHK